MRIAAGIEYDGSAYNGWQRVAVGSGVQETLERALHKVADHPVDTICAGRTDTGVHATGQVVHFDTASERSARGWQLGANSNLPDDVSVMWVRGVDADFHARYSATARTYRYVILNRTARSALYRHRAWWVYEPLAEEKMNEAARLLLGKHDFSAFRAAGCQARTAVREVTRLDVERHGDWLAVTVTANAFLQRMVRNLVGVLVAVGRDEQPPSWAGQVLASRDRTAGGIGAPPQGLTLVSVDYPDEHGVPVPPVPVLMPGID